MTTRRLFLFAVACAALLAISTPALADGRFRVIVHADNPITSVSRTTFAAMLLKLRKTWSGGAKVLPVDQRVGSKPRETMSRAVHGRTGAAIKNWWNQQIFAGRGVPPPELSSDARVIAFVTANAGAIGYVGPDVNVGTAKVITLTD